VASIEWTEDLSVKIPSIDNQHKVLIKLINKFDESRTQGNANMVLKSILKELVRYTQAHFLYEEALFTNFGYSESDNHKIAHVKLFEKVAQFDKAELAEDEELYSEISEFLNNWLYHHILKEDMAYSKHLVAQGAQ